MGKEVYIKGREGMPKKKAVRLMKPLEGEPRHCIRTTLTYKRQRRTSLIRREVNIRKRNSIPTEDGVRG